MAPTTVPRKNGVSTDEIANRLVAMRSARCRATTSPNANPAPRSTMPRAARLSGMNRVEKIAPKASENAVQSTTSTKISQT